MPDGLTDLRAPLTELATRLGAHCEVVPIPGTKWCYLREFALTVGDTTVLGTPRTTSKGALLGVILAVTVAAPLSNARIVARREQWLDRLGKRLRINREVQTGDPRVDRTVYFETDVADATLRNLFADQRARDVLLELLSGVAETVLVAPAPEEAMLRTQMGMGVRADSKDARPQDPRLVAEIASRTLAVEIPAGRFGDVASIARAAEALVRFGALLSETTGPAGPYGRGGLVALPPAARTRFGRGIAVAAIAVATWVGFGVLSAPPTFGWRAFELGAVLGAVSWSALVVVAIALLRGRSTSLRHVIVAAVVLLGAIPIGGRVGELLNAALGRGPFHVEAGTAVLRTGGKGATTKELQLASTGQSASVHGDLGDAVPFMPTPSRVRITVGRGALGSPFAAGIAVQ